MYARRTTLKILARGFAALALPLADGSAGPASAETFGAFLGALQNDAAAQGISRATFASAFAGVTPDPAVTAAMRGEPEYGKPMGAYLASLVSPARIAIGRRKLAQWVDTLRAVEQRFGVDPSILVSIWGIESSFGQARDPWDVFRSLATLAYARFQQPFFRNELLSALTILQQGGIPRQQFMGSWAGAMGQAQFLPSSYLKYAIDFHGGGRPNIWTSVPDVLASIANYLHQAGWQPGVPWGLEVNVPQAFDYQTSRATFAQWSARGLRRTDGEALPNAGDAILFFPSGASGPAFLVTENFIVIKTFNNSDAYALAVGELSDRMRGLPPLRAAWPANDFQPSRTERMALQRRLSSLGFTVKDFEGHIDFTLRDDIRQMQRKYGMIPDGYPSRALLARIGVDAR
jgi:membrane-bound lytic murein transglycosylase B